MIRILSRFAPLVLASGDLLVLLFFVLAGQREHELVNPDNPLLGLLLTTSEFGLTWLLVGWRLGAFPQDSSLNSRVLLANSLNTWLVSAPLAVLLRAFVIGRAVIPTAFLAVTLGLGGALVLGWRLIYVWLWPRLSHTRESAFARRD
jgi:DUF3054 family protein